MKTILSADGISYSFGRDLALREARLGIRSGECVAISGPSGSGKSTLLHCLSGLLRPSSGEVIFRGRAINQLSVDDLDGTRRECFGFVPQFGDLVSELNLCENVSLPLRFQGSTRRAAERAALSTLEQVGLSDLARRRPAEVSGGQMQRAAVARAMVHKPAIVFADEPTGALDSVSAGIVIDLLVDMCRSGGTTVVVVTHDLEVARRLDRVVSVRDGTVFDGELAGGGS